jgi:hypothetical protein
VLNRLSLNFAVFFIILLWELFFSLPVCCGDSTFHQAESFPGNYQIAQKPWKSDGGHFCCVRNFCAGDHFGGYGLNPDNINIIDLGVPLLESQVVYGVGLIVLMLWMDYGYGVRGFFSPRMGLAVEKNGIQWFLRVVGCYLSCVEFSRDSYLQQFCCGEHTAKL